MEGYIKPEMDIIVLTGADVITASCPEYVIETPEV